MRKLKNLELMGETRLIPGVGHVTFEEDVPEHVAEACEALGLDWVDALSVPKEAENGSDDEAGADADGEETPGMASVLDEAGVDSNSKRKKK
jgi:hypothetical protein